MNVPVPLDHFPVHALTSKVFSFMVKKGKYFSGKVTPLFASMLVQSTEDSDPLPRPSLTTNIPDSIPEDSGGNHGEESQTCYHTIQNLDEECLHEAKIGRKEILKDTVDVKGVFSTEDSLSTAQQKVSTDKEKVSTDRPNVSTDRPNVSTDRPKVYTDKEKDSTVSLDEGTVDQSEGRSATPTTPTTTPYKLVDEN
ncbi:hypothetical protein Tco_0817757 [Tanacetum coccineum]